MMHKPKLNALLTHDLHGLLYEKDGRYYTTGNTCYESWGKYLRDFDRVTVLLRATPTDRLPKGVRPLDGDRVKIAKLCEFSLNPSAIVSFFKNLVTIRKNVANADVIIIRAGLIGNLTFLVKPRKKEFAIEVAGDPYDVFSNEAFSHPLRPFIRWIYVLLLKRQCKRSAAVYYVTESTLQKRYPPNPNAHVCSCSDIELTADDYVPIAPQRAPYDGTGSVIIICVGNFYQLYKGQDDLIKAVAIAKQTGLNIKLVLVGSGKYQEHLQTLAQQQGILEDVEFTGALTSRTEIRKRLDNADIFVLPSRTEGLPRALIEAMARGKPCIGTKVGGIPELIPESCLVEPSQPNVLADKIIEILKDSTFSNEMAKRNLEKAKEYRTEVLSARRDQFYSAIRDSLNHH